MEPFNPDRWSGARRILLHRVFLVAIAVFHIAVPFIGGAQAAYDTTMFRTLDWRNIGPFRGGRATTAVGVPGDTLTYYMGATGGGVWKTDNAGQTWRNISDRFFGTGSIGDIAVSAANPSIVYVGTGEAPVRMQMSSYGDGVYKSTDAGRAWTHVGLENTRQISRVIVDPTDANVVFVAAQGSRWGPTEDRGIYRSTDGGASWEKILFVSPSAGASELVMDLRNSRVLYAAFWDYQRTPWDIRSGGPGSGIWKTTDGGENWRQLKNGLPATMGKIRLGVAPGNPNRLYATVESDSSGMFRSEDAGETWHAVAPNHGAIATRPWYYMGVTVDPKNQDVVYVSGATLIKSVDGGASYSGINEPHSDTHTLWINPSNPRNMICTNDGGASISFNGGTSWSPQDNQATAQFYAVQADELFPYNLYGGQQDSGPVVIASRTFGAGGISRANWHSTAGGESARFAFDPKDPTHVFGTNYLGAIDGEDAKTGLQRSVSLAPGQHLGYTAADMRYRFNWSAPLIASPFDPKVMYYGGNVLLRSIDEGNTWTPISKDLTRSEKTRHGRSGPFWHDGSGGEIYNTIFSVAPSASERGVIWVGSDDGLVHLTRDEGRTWSDVSPDRREGMVYNIEVSPNDNGTAYVAFSRHKWDDNAPYLYKTKDYGKSWTNIARTLPQNHPARVVREDPKRRDLLYAATEYGLWISFNGGASWQSFQRNMPRVPISDLLVHHNDLLAATEGRAFWILDDLTPLQQLSPSVSSTPLFLFKPRAAYRVAGGSGRGGGGGGGSLGSGGADAERTGPNPLSGAVIRYVLGAPLAAGDTLKLEIRDSTGALVRDYSTPSAQATRAGGAGAVEGRGAIADSAPAGAAGLGGFGAAAAGGGRGSSARGGRGGGGARSGGVPAPPVLSGNRGLNRFAWDLRTVPVTGATGAGAMTPSGRYSVRLILGATTLTQPLEILPDPRTGSSRASEVERYLLSRSLARQSVEINGTLHDLQDVRSQARAVSERAKSTPHPARDAAIRALIARLDSIERQLVPPASVQVPGWQLILNTGFGFSAEVSTLQGVIEGGFGHVTEGERWEATDYAWRWAEIKKAADAALNHDVERVNALLQNTGLTPGITRKMGTP